MKNRASLALVEELECRRLLAAVAPTAAEQYLFELINRARANPDATAAAFGIALNEGLPPATINSNAKQPLVMNLNLNDSTQSHSQHMLSTGTFGFSGIGDGTPASRIAAAGFASPGQFISAESISSAPGLLSAFTPVTAATNIALATYIRTQIFRNMFLDSADVNRDSRKALLTNAYREGGVGLESGNWAFGVPTDSTLATADFASRTGPTEFFLGGVVYTDAVLNDNFYTPGEGIGGATITVRDATTGAVVATTSTWAAGGYSVKLAPGTYNVTAAASALGGSVLWSGVQIGAENEKRDFVPGGGGSGEQDISPPSAVGFASKITKPGVLVHSVKVVYSDDVAIDLSTLGTGDVRVTGPSGYDVVGQFLGVDVGGNGSPRTAEYRIFSPPGGFIEGTYTITVVDSQVADTGGNFVAGGDVGTFIVKFAPLPGGNIPQAQLTAADVIFPGSAIHRIAVRFTDNNAIDISSITTGSILVGGPDGYLTTATFALMNDDTDGSPRVAYFDVPAPGGLWDSTDNGLYAVRVVRNTVMDDEGNFVPTGIIGTFNATIPDFGNRAAARDIGEMGVGRVARFNDFVGRRSRSDFYQFNVTVPTRIQIRLADLRQDIDVQLLSRGGTPLRTGGNEGTSPEVFSRVVQPGTYFIRVYSKAGSESNYSLRVTASEFIPPPAAMMVISSSSSMLGSVFSSAARISPSSLLDPDDTLLK